MPRVPFIGRLNLTEYAALFSSFFLVGFEAIIRIFTLALPTSIINLFYRLSRRLFDRFTSTASKRSAIRNKDISASIAVAPSFVDICALFGYYAEEHVVQTSDGYLLGLHRLGWKRGEEGTKVNCGKDSVQKRVVYLHHGLLMNSEVWVCLTDEARNLPFTLVERGYDVWFGNNRGNKYSKKSTHHSPSSSAFWDFSMDEFAFHDIPESIAYVLSTTSAPSLSYIGFSQGTAQAFATLAVNPKLNEQVDVFIALAPAMAPAGLSNGIVDALVKASPQVLFLLFGRRSLMSSTTMWQSILYPPIFARAIDMSLDFLFGWHANNISMSQKLAAYPHLYSFTSTKSVVHWFQIIRTKSFQMYDDDVQSSPYTSPTTRFFTKVAKFPTRNIKTPIVLLYGGSDSLVDIDAMMKELPPHTIATEIPHYEHLDFLWAREVDTLVFPHVFDALESFSDAEHSKEEFAKYRAARHLSITAGTQPPSYASEDDRTSAEDSYASIAGLPSTNGRGNAITNSRSNYNPSNGFPSQLTRNRLQTNHELNPDEDSSSPEITQKNGIENPSSSHLRTVRVSSGSGMGNDGANDAESRSKRSSSIGSLLNLGRSGGGIGISLGTSKVVPGVVSSGVDAQGVGTLTGGGSGQSVSGSDTERGKKRKVGKK